MLEYIYFEQALKLAQEYQGFCAPNPAVGAIVVKNNQILGTGQHKKAGMPHAEAEALNGLSQEDSQGASLYVTLEPCCHYGKTPPCTELLIARGISKVYYAFKDPNPLVSGKGEASLKAAGIDCVYFPIPEINHFYESYAYWIETHLPFVTLKLAMSLDGKIAGPRGVRVAITGLEAQKLTHECRKKSDAILTTSRTIICDNPELNVRLPEKVYKKPIYILDTHLKTPKTAKVFHTAQSLTIFHSPTANLKQKEQFELLGAHCLPISLDNGKINLNAVLNKIGQDGVHDLWVEAGGTCFQSFMAQKLTNRAFIYVAAKWLGEEATLAFKGGASAIFNSAHNLNWKTLGNDVLLTFSTK